MSTGNLITGPARQERMIARARANARILYDDDPLASQLVDGEWVIFSATVEEAHRHVTSRGNEWFEFLVTAAGQQLHCRIREGGQHDPAGPALKAGVIVQVFGRIRLDPMVNVIVNSLVIKPKEARSAPA